MQAYYTVYEENLKEFKSFMKSTTVDAYTAFFRKPAYK